MARGFGQSLQNVGFFSRCTSCGSTSHLVRISPSANFGELRRYECRSCLHIDSYEVASDPSIPWVRLQSTWRRLVTFPTIWWLSRSISVILCCSLALLPRPQTDRRLTSFQSLDGSDDFSASCPRGAAAAPGGGFARHISHWLAVGMICHTWSPTLSDRLDFIAEHFRVAPWISPQVGKDSAYRLRHAVFVEEAITSRLFPRNFFITLLRKLDNRIRASWLGVHRMCLPDGSSLQISDRRNSEQRLCAPHLLRTRDLDHPFAAHWVWLRPFLRRRWHLRKQQAPLSGFGPIHFSISTPSMIFNIERSIFERSITGWANSCAAGVITFQCNVAVIRRSIVRTSGYRHSPRRSFGVLQSYGVASSTLWELFRSAMKTSRVDYRAA